MGLRWSRTVSDVSAYCVAAVGHNADPKVILSSYPQVIAHLRATHDALINDYADQRAENAAEPDDVPLGGFGTWLRNRWGSEIEVGIGRDVWLLIRLQPRPTKRFSDRPSAAGWRAFY